MKDISIRADPRFKEKLNDISVERFKHEVDTDSKIRSTRELTKMMLNTDAWGAVETELKNKPRREDLP